MFKTGGRIRNILTGSTINSNVLVKKKVLCCVLSNEETQFSKEMFKILPEKYENDLKS